MYRNIVDDSKSQDRMPIDSAGTASHQEGSVRTSARGETKPGRPVLVLIMWATTLLVLAGLAPVVQAAVVPPFELLSLVMIAPSFACVVVLLVPSWMPQPWKRVGGSTVLPAEMGGAPLVLFLVLQAIGALSEEIGWRGVVQRCGGSFARPTVVSAIAGFLFGAIHLGYWELGFLPVLTFAFTAMLMSLTITTIFTGSFWQRMIPAVIVHLGHHLVTSDVDAGYKRPPGEVDSGPACSGMSRPVRGRHGDHACGSS